MQLTIQQAAQKPGITTRQVRYRISNGTLPANKVGGRGRLGPEHPACQAIYESLDLLART